MKNFLFKTIVALGFIIITVLVPSFTFAARQVTGEIPVQVPLQSKDEAVIPNYSNSIQSGDAINLPDTSSDQIDSTLKSEAQLQTEEKTSYWHIFIIILGAIFVFSAIGMYFWKRKGVVVPAIIFAFSLSTTLFLFSPHLSFAQIRNSTQENSNKPISRTILEEGSQTLNESSTAQSNLKPLYGIGMVVLLIIAAGGVWVFWTNSKK